MGDDIYGFKKSIVCAVLSVKQFPSMDKENQAEH